MNTVVLIGRLGADPETNGTVTTMRLATDRWTGKESVTDWHRVVCFGGLGARVAKYLKRGRQAAVRGKVTYSKWDKDGTTHYSTDIIADDIDFIGPAETQAEQPQAIAPADIPF